MRFLQRIAAVSGMGSRGQIPILANLQAGNQNATLEQDEPACRMAGVHEMIEALLVPDSQAR